jgi:DNA invertase Pin-like site-specific DNA recombinase
VRAALYLRVSSRDGRQETANQLPGLREFCKAIGWEIVHEYEDQDSGSKADRLEFQTMLAAAARREFDVLVVWSLDRLTREGVAETFMYIKRLADHGKFVSFTEEHFRTTGPAGELMIAVAAWIAKQERIRISERVRAGLRRVREQGSKSGKPIGRPRAVLRRDRVSELREQGLSWAKIAQELGTSDGTVRRVFQSTSNPATACQNPLAD